MSAKRAKLNQDTVERWEKYVANGKHVSYEAVDEWLAKLESGEVVGPPEPAQRT